MMRSNTSKDSSRGFQVSSEISFLISARKTLPISGQTIDVTSKKFLLGTKRPLNFPCTAASFGLQQSLNRSVASHWHDLEQPTGLDVAARCAAAFLCTCCWLEDGSDYCSDWPGAAEANSVIIKVQEPF